MMHNSTVNSYILSVRLQESRSLYWPVMSHDLNKWSIHHLHEINTYAWNEMIETWTRGLQLTWSLPVCLCVGRTVTTDSLLLDNCSHRSHAHRIELTHHPAPTTHHPQRHTNPPAGGLVTLLYNTTYIKIKIALIKKEKDWNQWWRQNTGPGGSVARQQSRKV